jgi:hypothetical protein
MRAEINEARERAGQKKVYLVRGPHADEEEEEQEGDGEGADPAATSKRQKQ